MTTHNFPTSALYVGHVRHRRTNPIQHQFRYRFYMALLDLAELEQLNQARPIIGFNRHALTTLYNRDHLGPSDTPIRQKLDRWLERQGVDPPDGPVLMLAQLRVLGYVFNPITLFYCYSSDGRLLYTVAEVHNTFGDIYPYLLQSDADLQPPNPKWLAAQASKAFHVSPFIGMDAVYKFHIRIPDDQRIHLHIEEFRLDERFMDATLTLEKRALGRRELLSLLLTHPVMPLMSIVLIHWQALILWRKHAPFFKYAPPPPNGLEEKPL